MKPFKVLSITGNDFKTLFLILGAALVAGLISTVSVSAAVVIEDHQNEPPEVGVGNHVAIQLGGPGMGAGLDLPGELSGELSKGTGSGLDHQPNGSLFADQDLTGETREIPKVIVTGAAMGFGGLAISGIFLLRRKDADISQP